MLQKILDKYLEIFPEEQSSLKVLIEQLANGEKLNDRRNFHGHITGSGIVLSPDKKEVLLIYHNFFQLWQQPGGHWEADEPNPWLAAWREVEEETAVSLKQQIALFGKDKTMPLDIDSHFIPARPHKAEPAHWHHDFRYLFLAAGKTSKYQAEEVSGARWYKLNDPATARITRPLVKLRQLAFVE